MTAATLGQDTRRHQIEREMAELKIAITVSRRFYPDGFDRREPCYVRFFELRDELETL